MTALSDARDAATLAALPDLEAIDLLLPDMNGLLRGKRVTRQALDKVFADGVCLPMSLIATDITGNTVEETGLGYDIGDEDRICRPVPGSLRPVPWTPRPTAQLLLAMEDGAGGLFEANPRQVLARVVQRFADLGLTPVVAIELEFYLFDRLPDAHGRPQPAINPNTGARNTSTQVYSIEDLDDNRDFIDAVAAVCRAQDIPADTAVAEYAPGQFEINLRHRADALQACDDAVMLKRAIKAVAQRQSLQASFMAKPLVDQAGSGLHVHVSLLDAQGSNVFAGTAQAPAAPLLHAIGGLQASAADTMLLFAPHANSYRRYVPNAFVPLGRSWGYNNRTVAMRIPHSDAANTRIEHRIAGADANVYLACAAVLAGMLHGLEQRLDPGPPIVGNAYVQTEQHNPHWRGSIEDFLGSAFIAEHFGERFRHLYGQQKRKEQRGFDTQVTDLDYAWYLRAV
ncbi:glutamine synthetase family protein [Pseudoxanthomonas winnipegensis]|jgi:glutamine synthetase|uniref:glutamine synthetase family protein n=1 Tax=Pseudoxanthomonas winnipegensis TaxID=2480810 RepID=UPI00102E0668|nr:glutamine synthetase family protein [Pseudoxanthomonas winnipegensis]TAA07938.1 glutamine synthetase [Pseudoxanthomonas winnipegensis]TAH72399.1 glutamine synthetase [Pseudoxanthomonas winnipegensis]